MLNEDEVKALAKGLRRELKVLGTSATALSHAQTLELLSRALGYSCYAQMQAALVGSQYPLVNRGQFDLASHGRVLTGLFVPLRGTLDRIPGTALATTARRDPHDTGRLLPDYEGETDVFWDAQEPVRDERGCALWETEQHTAVGEGQLIVVLYDFDPRDPKLPVRQALLEAYQEFFRQRGHARQDLAAELQRVLQDRTGRPRTRLLDQAARTLGFALVQAEREALKRALATR